MRTVSLVQTADGATHSDERAAKRHAEARYGVALSNIAHKLVRLEKYSAMMEFLDAHLTEFATLQALKADCELEPSTE